MDKAKIDRINFLAKKSKTEGLTEAELNEQKELRKEYIASYVNNLKAQLENTYIQDENGNKTKLKKKGE
ncbi:MAG: DUF896 domain-containing protein [Ruminococcaceae bacterium]|nr:DUF896 domain-containing protein [Oscillospiraceae bacterium]